ncbi:MAG: sulfatase-like hydrolase/transferase, partial [Verrucomicrobiota bacterium]
MIPNIVLLNGEAVEVIDRPSPDQITISYDPTGMTYPATLDVTFPGAISSVTGSYSPTIFGTTDILIILIDDWGVDSSPIDNIAGAYNGLAGAGGQDLPEMPALQTLAGQSIRFEHAYVQSACSPTRMTIMSGRLPSNHGVGAPGGPANSRDAVDIMTIAEAIDAANPSYASGLMGKWHLGTGTGPDEQGPGPDGWDVFWGAPQGNIDDYFDWRRTDVNEVTINQAGQATNETNYATTVNTDDAINFITNQVALGNPWLCWVTYNAPHSQNEAPTFHTPPTNGAGQVTMNGQVYTGALNNNRARYKAALWALDSEIDRLLSHVDLNNTTVILVGDNGTPGGRIVDENLFPGSHGKSTIYNGGLHVPFLIRPAGGTTARVISEPIGGHDLFPTMCELMGIDPATLGQNID